MIFPYVLSLIVLAAALYGGKYLMDLSVKHDGEAAGWYGFAGCVYVLICILVITFKILP